MKNAMPMIVLYFFFTTVDGWKYFANDKEENCF